MSDLVTVQVNDVVTGTVTETQVVDVGYSLPAGPTGSASGDLSGSYPAPSVTATHLASPLPIAQGGTGAASAAAALTALGAAASSQIPVSLPPDGSASGDLSGSYPGPTVARVNGLAVGASPGGTAGFLRADGTWSAPAPSSLAPAAMLVPVYSYPSPATFWNQLTAAGPAPVKYMVANASIAPGSTVDPNYTAVINAAVAAGITVLGYVDTNFGAVSLSTVQTDIGLWQSLYGVTSIFFDRASASTGQLSYYTTACGYVTGKKVLNHGTIPAQGYAALADVLVVFEDVQANWAAFTPPSWFSTCPPSQLAVLVYNCATAAQMTTVMTQARQYGVGNIYVTDQAGGNPWAAEPSYFAAEVSQALVPLSAYSPAANTTGWINVVTAYGADPAGVTDSASAIASAIAALPATGGVVYFPAGTYRVNTTITVTNPAVMLAGDGLWSSALMYYGSGDCIRMYSTSSYTSGYGGGIFGLMIDGTNASAGSAGAHIGDIYQFRCNFGARKFQGTSSKGVWFDNQYTWHEDMHGHLFVQQNTSNLVFDNSANLSGQATGSFARAMLTVVMDAKGVGNGVTLKNGAQVYAGQFNYQGNMDYSTTGTKYWALTVQAPAPISFTATSATPCVFTATGHYYGNGTAVFLAGSVPTGFTAGQSYYVVSTNISAGTFQLSATSGGSAIASTSTGSGTVETFQATTLHRCQVNINVECNATTGTQPGTINFTSSAAATGYNNISGCTGIIDFSANNAFAGASNQFGNFYFEGPVYGDISLWRSLGTGTSIYSNGALTSGSSIYANGVTLTRVNTTANLTGMILQAGNSSDAQLVVVENNGTGSITFAALATSHVRNGTSCVIPANTCMLFQWDVSQSSWYQVGGASPDTTAADIQPNGVQAAGASGLPADAGHVHPNESDLSLYLAPTGATGETFPREYATIYNTSLAALTSGTVYVSAIALPKGLVVNDLAVLVGSTAFATVTHGWFALLDSGGVVRAVTADQTTAMQTSFAQLKLAVGSAYTTVAAGCFYIAFCATAGTMGTLLCLSTGNLSTPQGVAPVLCGTAGTATTPPSTGTTLTVSYASNNPRFYGNTS